MKIIKLAASILLLLSLQNQIVFAQDPANSPELMQLIDNAGKCLDRKDYGQAEMLYKQAIRLAPDNVGLRKDLAYTYLLKREFEQARSIITPVVNSSAADAQCFQIAAGIELADGNSSKAKKIINSGLDKFPNAGVLYNTKGNILISGAKSNKEALKEWIKGIASDPNYATNYFNAANAMFENKDYVWSIVYAEKYINMDAQSPLAVDMRKKLMEAYKLIGTSAADSDLPDFNKDKNSNSSSDEGFEAAFKSAINANISTIADGVNTENLGMLRTRFLIYWNNNFENKFPQSIISYQSRLMKNGHYIAYNQWLFGAIESSQSFSTWVSQFKNEYQQFEQWRQKNPYQASMGDVTFRIR